MPFSAENALFCWGPLSPKACDAASVTVMAGVGSQETLPPRVGACSHLLIAFG